MTDYNGENFHCLPDDEVKEDPYEKAWKNGFRPYSTGEHGEPFMLIDEATGMGKLLLIESTDATQMIRQHGVKK